MNRLARLSLLCAMVGGTVGTSSVLATEAHACGGTFCDAGPQPMPVDQSGENILFVRDGDMIEAHIQIQYMGDPEEFGWVIPLTAEPEQIAAGSEPLFQNLLAASVPTYGLSTTSDQCQAPESDPNSDGVGTGAAGGDDGFGEDGGGDGGGPDILLMKQVGAFEVTVLTAEKASDVADWLDVNGYEQDDEALPILQEYLDEGHVFAAVKLVVGAGVDEIHPIMLRFKSEEACVPLRLTRIAAVENMEVRTFFLGDNRVAPRTYRHVEVNPLKIDWPNQGSNYKEVISLAVDEENADGRAFVTEYAGTSENVSTFGIVDDNWDANRFRTIEPVAVIGELTNQGLFQCGEDFDTFEFVCRSTHSLVQPLIDQYLPVPEGIQPVDFYQNPANFEDLIDLEVWDSEAFASDLEARVFEPGRHAAELLQNNDYLTRMYTTISPAEMTADPMFHENAQLEEVAQTRTANRRNLCNGDVLWTLPDGREIYVPVGMGWPDFDAEAPMDAPMPTAEFIDDVPATGAPMRLTDNQEVIDAQLRLYNEGAGWNGATIDEGEGASPAKAGGCGCRTSNPAGALWMLGFGIALFGARRRRN